MQVNLNTNINQSRPQFGKLKAINFETRCDRNFLKHDFQARKKLLEVCELPIIKKIFNKYDGTISFRVDNTTKGRGALCSMILEPNESEIIELGNLYMQRGIKEAGDYEDFEPRMYCSGFLRTIGASADIGNTMKAIEALIDKIRSYDDSFFDKLQKDYNQHSSDILESYKDICERKLRYMIYRANKVTVEEKEEFATKFNELLGNK